MIVKRFGCTTIHKKRYINASFINSFMPLGTSLCWLPLQGHTGQLEGFYRDFQWLDAVITTLYLSRPTNK